MNAGDEKLAEHARRLLDESVEHLDGETLSKLNQARQQALEAARQPRRTAPAWWAIPAGGALAAFVAAAIWWPGTSPDPSLRASPPIEDMEILVSADSLEMLEDLEFFMWLEETGVDAG